MRRSLMEAAMLGALLCAPAFAQTSKTDSGSTAAPSSRVDSGKQPDTYREAPNASPTTTPGVTPRQPYRAPGYAQPPAAQPVPEQPEAGRRWGLIVFVVALVGLALLAFRRRNPMPPSP